MTRALLISLLVIPLLPACSSTTPPNTVSKPDELRAAIASRMVRDLRQFFRSREEISDLEKEGLCSVEPGGLVSRRRQVPVGAGLSLEKVVHALVGHGYDGQIRVIARDSIIQTSLV